VAVKGCRLIVHADDFGISEYVNEGICLAHQEDIITSTSIMATGRAFGHGISLLKKLVLRCRDSSDTSRGNTDPRTSRYSKDCGGGWLIFRPCNNIYQEVLNRKDAIVANQEGTGDANL
jgi:YdjC-like protein